MKQVCLAHIYYLKYASCFSTRSLISSTPQLPLQTLHPPHIFRCERCLTSSTVQFPKTEDAVAWFSVLNQWCVSKKYTITFIRIRQAFFSSFFNFFLHLPLFTIKIPAKDLFIHRKKFSKNRSYQPESSIFSSLGDDKNFTLMYI